MAVYITVCLHSVYITCIYISKIPSFHRNYQNDFLREAFKENTVNWAVFNLCKLAFLASAVEAKNDTSPIMSLMLSFLLQET